MLQNKLRDSRRVSSRIRKPGEIEWARDTQHDGETVTMSHADPSPRVVRKCAECGEPYALRVDGGIGSREPPWPDLFDSFVTTFTEQVLVICPNCEELVFANSCKKLTEIPGFSFDVDYVDVKPSTPPTYKKCRQLVDQLEAGLRLSRTRQIQLRKWLWWTGNHPRRYEASDIPLSPSERTNLLALKEILDLDKDSNLITVVEICRELGEFDAMRSYESKIQGKSEREFVADVIALSDSHGNKFISL